MASYPIAEPFDVVEANLLVKEAVDTDDYRVGSRYLSIVLERALDLSEEGYKRLFWACSGGEYRPAELRA